MKNNRSLSRIFAMLLVILLFAQPLCVQASPATATISAVPANAVPGEDVTVLVNLANNSGINGLTLQVGYNSSALTLVSVTDKNLFGAKPTQSPNLTKNPYSIIWATAGNITANGALVELTFHVADTASGTQTLTLSATAFDENDNSVAVETQNAEITIAEDNTFIEQIQVAESSTQVEATVHCEEGVTAKALCAMYENGKLVSVRIVELKTGDNELTFTGYNPALTAKLFVLDADTAAPLCKALSAN